MIKEVLLFSFLLHISYASVAQNIGIGTATPASKLHVKGTGSGTQIVLEENGGSIVRISNEPSGTGPYIGTTTNNPLSLVTNNSAKLTISTTGNIGFGQPNPTSPLHFSNTLGNKIALWGTNPNHYGIGIQAFQMQFFTPANTDDFVFGVGNSSSLIETMRIKGNGNVGIGTNNPQTTLDVNGAIKVGHSTNSIAGSIRYNSSAFQGFTGNSWITFDQLPAGTVVGSQIYPNTELEQQGYKFRAFIPNLTKKIDKIGAALNSWEYLAKQSVTDPINRYNHCQVWTGSGMIIWGGSSSSTNTMGLGRKYNPANNVWTSISSNNQPADRKEAVAFWTGSEMIVWGGFTYNTTLEVYEPINTGGRYNASLDIWTPVGITNAPSVRYAFSSVWTGTEMIIWGGYDGAAPLNTGARYNPATNSWTTINTTNAPVARNGHCAVWTGSEMIIWGGYDGTTLLNTGARYNPVTNSWTTITTTTAPVPRNGHSAVWTGSEMIIWGGQNGGTLGTGAKYNPSTDTWITLNTGNASGPVREHQALWNGNYMYVWGGNNGLGGPSQVVYRNMYRYNPTTNSWSSFTSANSNVAASSHKMTLAGDQIIIYGGLLPGPQPSNTGVRFFTSALPTYNLYNEVTGDFYLYSKE